MTKKVALVTGSNKGIGLEIVRQLAKDGFKTILTSRDENRGKEAVKSLNDQGLDVDYCQLEVSNSESIQKAYEYVEKTYGRLDVLVNNAGIFGNHTKDVFNVDINEIKETVETNFYGVLLVTQAFIKLMKKNNYGRIVNISSGMGQLEDMGGGYYGYRISKVSLNAITKIMAEELKGSNILVNTMCPGWVKTDMGGASAPRTVEQGADTAVWLSQLEDNGPSGKFFRDRKEIAW